ncbi:MAG: response regulator transcription factor [Archangium sp.]|nr:response regulator transcription factor [Archangium sp.]
MPARVLIVDDDGGQRSRVRGFLGQYSIEVAEAASGEEALAMLARASFEAVLLDVVMPGMDGVEVMRRIRAMSDVPILMLSARDSEADQVVGLELGADDYIVKPFRARELLARLRAVLRRSGVKQPEPAPPPGRGVEIDCGARLARLDGRTLELSGIEFDLLSAFVRNKGLVLPRERLLAEAGRTQTTVTERTVDVHVSRLRKKLEDDPPRLIKTVHGIGYVFAG